jgi:hypothetical protein
LQDERFNKPQTPIAIEESPMEELEVPNVNINEEA